ncbi:acyl-CoA dehydrogenase family protein [Streptomyces afghaniensis]
MTATETAMATWWVTERQQQLSSRCPQLRGGYGYMTECPIGRDFVGTRRRAVRRHHGDHAEAIGRPLLH